MIKCFYNSATICDTETLQLFCVNRVLHLLLLLTMPPLLLGVINKTKAVAAGRKGPPLLQPYYDITKLLRKGVVISSTTSMIFWLAPVVVVATSLLAGLLTPLGPFQAPIAFAGDAILFVYLFALSRFFTTAAALDTGSSFEGMGTAREVTFASLAEPALFFVLLVMARISGALSLSDMLRSPLSAPLSMTTAPLILVSVGMFIILLAENCRIPVDDPNTHLELTMIHEVMILDHGGPLLGLMLYGASVKLFVLGAFFMHLIFPLQCNQPILDWLLFVGRMLSLAVIIGVVESVMARLQMRRVPFLLIAALFCCGFGFILLVK